MEQEQLLESMLAAGLHSVVMTRYCLIAAYVICIYDWIISLDEEVALIYPAPWNVVKCAYLFCRHFPLVIAPFHLWGLLGDHDEHFCESYYVAIFACTIPTVLSSQLILMLRTYAFSGKNKTVLAILSIAFFGLVGVLIWVTSKELSLPILILAVERSGCFSLSDQPSFGALITFQQVGQIDVPIAYHIGLIPIMSTFFDCLNVSIVVWHCVQRGTLGPLGKSFLKQGMLVYVVMTALNALTIGAYFSPFLVIKGFAATATLAYGLPSALACRLVLMLRREASPTQTELRLEHSHMINEAIEMVTAMESHSKGLSKGFIPTNAPGHTFF